MTRSGGRGADSRGDDVRPLLADGLPTVADRLAAHDRLALCLDFDGTLAPIVEDPDAAAIPPATRERLTALADRPAVDVAIVSGRALTDVRDRVDLSGIDYAGNHGLEIERDGEIRRHPEVERRRDALDRTCRRLEGELDAIPGATVEDKYATATVHYRQVDRDAVGTVRSTVERAVAREEGLVTTEGDEVIEIRPDVDWGKGKAVESVADPDPDAVTAYLGDDRTDADAFDALAATDGASVPVAVGDPLPGAEFLVAGPDEVRAFLDWLADAPIGPAPSN